MEESPVCGHLQSNFNGENDSKNYIKIKENLVPKGEVSDGVLSCQGDAAEQDEK